jgi:hypothetical protein
MHNMASLQNVDPTGIIVKYLPEKQKMENKQLIETISGNAQNVLFHFLSMPLWRSCEIFETFRSLGGQSQYSANPMNVKERFLYIEGTREDKVVLIAHADTCFDEAYGYRQAGHTLNMEDDIISGKDSAIGADDRAGCAILWLLRNSGHSMLITDGEEYGLKGSNWLCENHPDILGRLNNHNFMVQLDRRNGRDFTCYRVGTPEFKKFVQENTGFHEPDNVATSDISVLCKKIPGVNLSTGYYNPHTSTEYLVYSEWHHCLVTVTNWLSQKLPSFELSHETQRMMWQR